MKKQRWRVSYYYNDMPDVSYHRSWTTNKQEVERAVDKANALDQANLLPERKLIARKGKT